MRTKVKIPQHNRLDADSFVSVKLWKQTKSCTNICEGSKNLLREFFRDATGSTAIFLHRI